MKKQPKRTRKFDGKKYSYGIKVGKKPSKSWNRKARKEAKKDKLHYRVVKSYGQYHAYTRRKKGNKKAKKRKK